MTNTAETHALVQREKGKKHMIQRRLLPAYLFLIIISFLSVFPLLWMISAATNTSLDVARGKIMFGTYAMQNFKNLIASQNLAGAMGNSFLYAIVQTVISMFVCSLAGFGFELYHDKNKDRLFSILLLAMMVPQVATMVPLFKMMSSWLSSICSPAISPCSIGPDPGPSVSYITESFIIQRSSEMN